MKEPAHDLIALAAPRLFGIIAGARLTWCWAARCSGGSAKTATPTTN